MGPKIVIDKIEKIEGGTNVVKSKRGRKSKQELLAAQLNVEKVELIVKDIGDTNNNIQNPLNLVNDAGTLIQEPINNVINDKTNNVIIIPNHETTTEKPTAKKRGRKPKGGKIVQPIVPNIVKIEDKPNIMLHLKCFIKDLMNNSQNNSKIESYNGMNNDLQYEIIKNDNHNKNFSVENDTMSDTEDEPICKDINKEIYKEINKKLKYLENDLHINNVNNKRSACFWDTCDFDNSPIYIPKHFINNAYEVYGCFCSAECAVAYLFNENIDMSTKFERYHLLNHIYGKIYGHNKVIKPAAPPYYMLEKYYGNLTIQEYRALLRNERFFLVIDKPLTRVMPELHEDNDEFILNNKIIPSNTYQVKSSRLLRKKNKSSILNETFGVSKHTTVE